MAKGEKEGEALADAAQSAAGSLSIMTEWLESLRDNVGHVAASVQEVRDELKKLNKTLEKLVPQQSKK